MVLVILYTEVTMFLKLKENCSFTDNNTGITSGDCIGKIYQLTITSNNRVFSGHFYFLVYFNDNSNNPFYSQLIELTDEIIKNYCIIDVANISGDTIDLINVIEDLCYQYLLTLFPDWEIVNEEINN